MKTKELFRILFAALIVIGYTSCGDKERKPADDKPRKIEMLFLGHAQEHHNSRKYFPMLASALGPEGINFTYTENLQELNKENLAKYDGVVLYANYEGRHPEQEEALMEYVEQGHAFIPIHCASFCFKDSSDYVDLVGGQFHTHETGEFTAEIVNQEHPAMEGVTEFQTWDETYVHQQLQDDITVLMERVEGESREPWTWVKQYGDGKVFYTAYGHDERSWGKEGFQKLISQGILWAVGEQARKNRDAYISDMPVLKYEEKDNIPNYERRDPAPKYQLPLSPEESAKTIQVPPGFRLELFASEPDIINPIAMQWDEKGRLWVVETVDYPNTVRDEKGKGDDRIKILEDTDNDGKADKITVFADSLNIPTGFVFSGDGIIVSQAPQFLFLRDTDGDDKADLREVLIEGWGIFDTHAGPSNLFYGIDNQIYGVVGYSGFEGEIFGNPQKFSQGIYRFDPAQRTFEFLTNTSNNTWGIGISEDNGIFASTANNTHSVFMGIPNRLLEDIKGIPAAGSRKIDGHYDMQPITPNYRQVDVFGGFTAAAGHHFYTARTYPSKYWNRIAFVCEPTGGLVHQAEIIPDGAGFIEKDAGNLIASYDEWFSPVEAKVGPDGAVWILDWYNFIIQHNPTPTAERGGFNAENGEGNAYVNPLRDRSRGRIWRVVPADTELEDITLSVENPQELVDMLSHSNMFWRLNAQRLLVERGKTDKLEALHSLIRDKATDEIGENPGALHALWTLDGLGVTSQPESKQVVVGALTHPSAAVRKAAVQILPPGPETAKSILKAGLLEDPDPKVRLQTLLYFAENPHDKALGARLFKMSTDASIEKDFWLSKALYLAASTHRDGFAEAYHAAAPTSGDEQELTLNPQRERKEFDDSKWEQMELPQYIESAGLDVDGLIWFRRSFDAGPAVAGKNVKLSLGPIDDSDVVYLNGKKIGETKNAYAENREYDIPAGIVVQGKNILAIQVDDTGAGGGLYGSPDQLWIGTSQEKISLSGNWKYEVEKDYSGSTDAFEGTSIAGVLMAAYQEELKSAAPADGSSGEVQSIRIRTVKNEMKYDREQFVVEAGKAVELTLENVDFMQHNLIIVAKGAKEKVGAAADKLAMDPSGEEKQYIPDMEEVLFATSLVDPEKTVVLKFIAPTEPGSYPFICTFPGHWRLMQGVMEVVEAKDAL